MVGQTGNREGGTEIEIETERDGRDSLCFATEHSIDCTTLALLHD